LVMPLSVISLEVAYVDQPSNLNAFPKLAFTLSGRLKWLLIEIDLLEILSNAVVAY